MVNRADVVEIDLSAVATAHDLHRAMAQSLGFPDFYGCNWAAFWDAITGLVEMPHCLRLVVWSGLVVRLPEDAKHHQSCLNDAIAEYPKLSAKVEYV